MDLAVVFHPPLPGERVQDGKLESPRNDPPSGGGGGERACASLHRKVCARAPDRSPGGTYIIQTTGGSAETPGGTVHFRELIAIFFH
jgi:hypothetical protein